jgi:hypothetical protein
VARDLTRDLTTLRRDGTALATGSGMIDEPLKDDPRKGDLPHTGVDDPGQKPPASDPQNRKGPMKDPPAKAPAANDPPAEPHVPGDPAPEIKDPPAPGSTPMEPGVTIDDPNFV